jgi:hypothetical protein
MNGHTLSPDRMVMSSAVVRLRLRTPIQTHRMNKQRIYWKELPSYVLKSKDVRLSPLM